MQATLVSFIDCHMKYTVLKLFEAGLGSSVSTIIFSGVAVARFLRVCYCVLVCVKKERHGKQMLSTAQKFTTPDFSGLWGVLAMTRTMKIEMGHSKNYYFARRSKKYVGVVPAAHVPPGRRGAACGK
mmetsp:Transcript_66268/g.110715  ORF Transcript_66268/g.110715 Transcript_66268/m.110715 type:complete len:127 (-) Transcript_66268:20-400(-)